MHVLLEGGPGADPGHKRDSIYGLAWECLGVPLEEVEEKKVWASWHRLLPQD